MTLPRGPLDGFWLTQWVDKKALTVWEKLKGIPKRSLLTKVKCYYCQSYYIWKFILDITEWTNWEDCPEKCGVNSISRTRLCERYFMTTNQERNATIIPEDKPCEDIELTEKRDCDIPLSCIGMWYWKLLSVM